LKNLFPESAVVFMLRNPRAVVASFLRYKASSLRTESDFWICDTLEEPIRSYRRYIRPGINLAEHLKFVRYEDVIAHRLSTLQQVSRKLGIEFAPQMLEARGSSESEFFEGTSKRGGALPEWKKGALGTIDPALADNWRHELSAQQNAYTSDELSVFLSRFGYVHVAD
jgi:Sulfotransferase family